MPALCSCCRGPSDVVLNDRAIPAVTRASAPEVPRVSDRDLIRHYELFFGDWNIGQAGPGTGAVGAYLRARRKAPHFSPGRPDHNNHRYIPTDELVAIYEMAGQTGSLRTAVCERCGSDFIAKRSTARFCGSRCRVAASRE